MHPGADRAPDATRLLDLIDRMAGRPVVMLVDPVADRFVTGTPKRISREAPVLILRYEGEHLAPGGGANAVANVAALGGRPLPLGFVGDDDSGHGLRAALAERGVDVSGLRVRAGYRTPTKVRIVGGARHALKQQIVRYDIEDELTLTPQDIEAHCRQVADWCQDGGPGEGGSVSGGWTDGSDGGPPRVAVLSDYGYGGVTPALVAPLRQALGGGGSGGSRDDHADAVLLCDSRYRLAELCAAGCDGATPNEEEAEALHGGPLQTVGGTAGGTETPGTTLGTVGESLRQRLGVGFLLVTRGSRGMSLFDDGGAAHLPVHGGDQVADVTGAGDTVIGTFALALAAGATPLEAALLADYAGGVVVMKLGTATLTAAELTAAVEGDAAPLTQLCREAR